MLDPLVYGKNGDVPGICKAAMTEKGLEAVQHACGTVRGCVATIDEVRSREMQVRRRNGATGMFEEGRVLAENADDGVQS